MSEEKSEKERWGAALKTIFYVGQAFQMELEKNPTPDYNELMKWFKRLLEILDDPIAAAEQMEQIREQKNKEQDE